MATKKDLVEAYAYSRRRLVTAFVSGAPGGREVEPARPGRTVVAGLALAVLLLAGAAIAGVFSDRPDVDWEQPGLVIDKDSGALYVILEDGAVPGSDEPTLRSVVNVTSAQLILGADATAQPVPGDDIADRPKGPPIGIIGAPATVPAADQLVNGGWTACTGEGYGVHADVSGDPDVAEDDDAAFVVSSGDRLYLVAPSPESGPEVPATARAYPLPRGADALTTKIGVGLTGDAVHVPAAWVALLRPGGPLDADGLGIDGAGSPVRGEVADAVPPGTRVGDWFVTDAGQRFVVTEEGAAQLDDFAYEVLRSTTLRGHRPQEITGSVDDTAIAYTAAPWAGSHWPTDALDNPVAEGDQLCAVLHTAPGTPPSAALAVDPGERASAEGTGPREVDVTVTAGHGAVVDAGGWAGEQGLPVLVDDRGMSYTLRGDDAVANLGYAGVDEVVVPDGWMELFDPGPELSPDQALCPPTTDPEASCG
ncbi:MAG TPA: type VII secretion protein EccB [Nocardioides sp.]|nr:type VII secretion protein EccB [Nocardioides sp.]